MADLHLHVLACPEPFEAMTPSERGRSCARCTREVVDTRALDRAGLEALARESRKREVCAHFQSVGGRVRLAAGLAAGVSIALAGCATPPAPALSPAENTEQGAVATGSARIDGQIYDKDSGEPLENAIVVLQSRSLPQQQERMTDAEGVFMFQDLPPGSYTVQVLAGHANVSKLIELRDGRYRVNFSVEPNRSRIMGILIEPSAVPLSADSSMSFDFDSGDGHSGRAHPVNAPRTRRER